MKSLLISNILFLLFLWNPILYGQLADKVISKSYKAIDTIDLKMDIYYPEGFSKGEQLPVIVFFFGGGWKGGTIEQFRPQAKYFASRGIIAALADYRVSSRHGTTPFESVKDAKSAIRYLRMHQKELGIHPDKIIAAGGSAGGHLAAATALVPGLEEEGEDLSISSQSNAMVLFNPVYNNGPDQYGYDRIGERYPEISPRHNIRKGAPPAIVFFGTEDPLVSPETAKDFDAAMEEVGSVCETFLYEGQKHGFFNFSKPKYYKETVFQSDRFLNKLGYLAGQPTIERMREEK
ncbi:MAG: alpha/beta hydrolase [Bacteroidota bacterium]